MDEIVEENGRTYHVYKNGSMIPVFVVPKKKVKEANETRIYAAE